MPRLVVDVASSWSLRSSCASSDSALAGRGTIDDQLAAQQTLVAATQRVYDLTEARYRGGIDSSLSLLDAQRELYVAQQSLIVTQLARETNLVTLYRVLGGGWKAGP